MRKPFRVSVVCSFWILLLCQGIQMSAQTSDRNKPETPVRFKDTIWYDKGFDFYIGGGMFIANKYNANYYNGREENECNLHYLFDNQYWYRDIFQEVVKQYPYVTLNDSIYYKEYGLPSQMHYKLKTGIGLGLRYKFADGWALSLSYTFARLTARDQFLLNYTSVAGNEKDNPVMYLYAREDRSLFDLSFSYLFHFHRVIRPFVEAGIQFNFVNVKEFKTYIGDLGLSLLNPYVGASYVPGAQINTYNIKYGGPGFGFSAAAGVKFVFNKIFSLDPTFYVSVSKLGLPGYRRFAVSYCIMLRLVMSDFFMFV